MDELLVEKEVTLHCKRSVYSIPETGRVEQRWADVKLLAAGQAGRVRVREPYAIPSETGKSLLTQGRSTP